MELLNDLEMLLIIIVPVISLAGWLTGLQIKSKDADGLSKSNQHRLECLEKEHALLEQKINQIITDVVKGNDLATRTVEVITELRVAITKLGSDMKHVKNRLDKNI